MLYLMPLSLSLVLNQCLNPLSGAAIVSNIKLKMKWPGILQNQTKYSLQVVHLFTAHQWGYMKRAAVAAGRRDRWKIEGYYILCFNRKERAEKVDACTTNEETWWKAHSYRKLEFITKRCGCRSCLSLAISSGRIFHRLLIMQLPAASVLLAFYCRCNSKQGSKKKTKKTRRQKKKNRRCEAHFQFEQFSNFSKPLEWINR